jgi:hypothetical protein
MSFPERSHHIRRTRDGGYRAVPTATTSSLQARRIQDGISALETARKRFWPAYMDEPDPTRKAKIKAVVDEVDKLLTEYGLETL